MTEKGETEKGIDLRRVLGITLMTSCIIAIIPLLPTYFMVNDKIYIPQSIIFIMVIQLIIVGIIIILFIIAIKISYKYKGKKLS